MDEPRTDTRKHILLVEDDMHIRFLIDRHLSRENYHVHLAEDGASALEYLEVNEVDLVILDLMLPDMDGYEICRIIRKQHTLKDLPILMLSALGDNVDQRVQGLEVGANDFMAKPFEFKELLARARALLKVKAEAEQQESAMMRYVSRALRSHKMLDTRLADERRQGQAVILFADLRGFTAFSVRADLSNVLHLLDSFFDSMMEVIDSYGGIVFDVRGDELMAVFNLPYSVPFPDFLAVQTAMEMQRIFHLASRQWAKQNFNVGMGIGIHRGEVLLGNLGGAGMMRYTVLGAPVNYAHRLCSLAGDGEIIFSEAVQNQIATSPLKSDREQAEVMLKGFDTPQRIYRLKTQCVSHTALAEG